MAGITTEQHGKEPGDIRVTVRDRVRVDGAMFSWSYHDAVDPSRER